MLPTSHLTPVQLLASFTSVETSPSVEGQLVVTLTQDSCHPSYTLRGLAALVDAVFTWSSPHCSWPVFSPPHSWLTSSIPCTHTGRSSCLSLVSGTCTFQNLLSEPPQIAKPIFSTPALEHVVFHRTRPKACWFGATLAVSPLTSCGQPHEEFAHLEIIGIILTSSIEWGHPCIWLPK